MTQRIASGRDLAALGVVGAIVCCGVPVLLAAGAGVTVLGVGLGSWALILAGACAAIAGLATWRHGHRHADCVVDGDE
jgi:hypothetical protein